MKTEVRIRPFESRMALNEALTERLAWEIENAGKGAMAIMLRGGHTHLRDSHARRRHHAFARLPGAGGAQADAVRHAGAAVLGRALRARDVGREQFPRG